MSLLVVGLLAVLWASILLPGALRSRRQASPQNTIEGFERTMGMLAMRTSSRPASGRQVLVLPPSAHAAPASPRARAAHRRRQVLARLAVATVASGLLALLVGGAFWGLFGLVGATLVSYVVVLAHLQSRRVETRRKVRRMPVVAAPAAGGSLVDGLYIDDRAHGG